MEEKNNKTEPQEVVLQYVAPSREVVSCYVAPGKTPQLPQSAELPPKRGKGRRRFLIVLTILAVLALAAAGFNLLGSVSIGFGTGDGYYYFGSDPQDLFEDEVLGEPAMPRFTDYDDSVRLLITEQRGETLPVQEIYERVNPSTVTVVAEIEGNRAGIGTGIIMTADGYILTNAHVIADALDCFIVLDTGEQYDVSLVGYDMEQDIAVLKAEAEGLPAAQFGDSDALRVGDPVYAIGNPLGIELRGTLTDGIVSAINRDVELDGVRMTLIQTNAALNSGNSGGPLINACGQVVGINLMKMDRSGRPIASVEGLGFAIPIASVAYMVDDIIACGEVRGEPVLGITVLNAENVEKNGTPGIEIQTVDEGSPGEKAGLLAGDIIVEADGEEIHSSDDLLRVRRRYRAGDVLTMRIDRGGERMTFAVTLERAK